MNLSFDEKRDIINYRVEKAYRTIKEAKDNAALGNWSLAANRLYYAIFYIALANFIQLSMTKKITECRD